MKNVSNSKGGKIPFAWYTARKPKYKQGGSH